jgi:protein tyrosine phosphatase
LLEGNIATLFDAAFFYRDADPLTTGNDYINANYIRQEEDTTSKFQGFKQYIATQVIASYNLCNV